MTRYSDSRLVSRRTLLQSLGVVGTAGLAGCMGGDSDQDSESTDTVDQTPEQTEDPGPDYSVPESEHMDLGQMARDWGAVLDGGIIAGGWSPSQMYDLADTTWIGPISDEIYDVFDFQVHDIPETFVQGSYGEGPGVVKADQNPANVTKEGLMEALEAEGFERERETEDFAIYTNPSRSEARAVSDEYHITSFSSNPNRGYTVTEHLDQLDTVLNHHLSEEMQINDHAQDVLDRLSVSDYLAIATPELEHNYLVSAMDTEKRPVAAVFTGDLNSGVKEVGWKFPNETFAEEAYSIITSRNEEYDSIDREGKYILRSGNFNTPDDHKHIFPREPAF